jgi:hypothetical protein
MFLKSLFQTMIEFAEEIFPEALDGPVYERHIIQIAPNDSDNDNLSSVTDSTSNPSSPLLNHNSPNGTGKISNVSSPASPNSPESVMQNDVFPYHNTEGIRTLSIEIPGKIILDLLIGCSKSGKHNVLSSE